jgi:iron complex outermembrane receptor protein
MNRSSTRRAFRPAPCARAVALAFCATAFAAQAQQPAVSKVEKVEVTGSSIKRIEGETALPVEVITREDIAKSGVTTSAELLAKVSSNTAPLTDGVSFSDVGKQRGFNGANLRGLGVSSTLVLLNGRRLANYALPGVNSGVDLNSIPAAAIERVEILKDGASAIYGADAIGGVINFITRKDYEGAQVTVYASDTQDGGAGKTSITLSGGIGSLAKDRWNVQGTFDYADTKELRTTQRNFTNTAYIPSEGIDFLSSRSYPANINAGSRGLFNPSAPNCNPPATVYLPGSFVGRNACAYDYMQDTLIYPPSKRTSFTGRGEFAINADHSLFAEYLYSNVESTYRISPLTLGNITYPASGRYYPTAYAAANGLSGPLRLQMRLAEAGGRENQVTSDSQRLVGGAKGVVAGWDYDTAFTWAENRTTDKYSSGYVQTTPFNAFFATGNLNPFGPTDAAGLALLEATKISDDARKSTGKTTSWDGKVTKELWNLKGGPVALALGAEYRREEMDFKPSDLLARGEIRGEGTAEPLSGSRNVTAFFAEVNLPFTKTIEAQVALRYDDYSDFGSTVNPKFALRWMPTKGFLARASYGEGFRAPTLPDIYSQVRTGQTSGIYSDSQRCVKTPTVDNTKNPTDCNTQFDTRTGGNRDLKPEESKQYSVGFVLEPAVALSFSADYWKIEKEKVIGDVGEGNIFADLNKYAAFVRRGAPDIPGLPGPIDEVLLVRGNLGKLDAQGVDLGFDFRQPLGSYGKGRIGLNGTYILHYKRQTEPGGSFIENVGKFVNDQAIQRWKHVLTMDWERGAWGATVQQTFSLGYTDHNSQSGQNRRVGSYELWDVAGSWTPDKAWKARVGIKNILDRQPPLSNQAFYFLAGYDPTYSDPRGRTYYGSLSYTFK